MSVTIVFVSILLIVVVGLCIFRFLKDGDDKQYIDKCISINKMPKRFEFVDGQKVVAFPCHHYWQPNKTRAIKNAMIPGTAISDAECNEYVVMQYLERDSRNKHIFHRNGCYLVFSISATGNKTEEAGVEFIFEKFMSENAARKAAVTAGTLSEEDYIVWLKQQYLIIEGR